MSVFTEFLTTSFCTMTLNEFIERYDLDGAVILLEGKRNVLDADREKLIALGKVLASGSSKMIFRSGNAEGSDFLFSQGVAAVNRQRLQVITPYDGHRKKANLAYDTVSLDEINLASEPDIIYASKENKKIENQVNRYVEGERDKYAMKAAYIIRDTVKVLGTGNIPQATFGIFYDDLRKPMEGGTGHTMRVCLKHEVPIIDQRVWFNWIS